MRAQALSGAWCISACEDTDSRICVYMCRVYRRACVCMRVHVCVFVRGHIGSCVCVASIEVRACVCARFAHERVHAFVRVFKCFSFV